MSKARRPPGATSVAATGMIFAKRSTARRITRSNAAGVVAASCSARPENTLMSVNVRARMTSRRKVAFL
jgi:hypothetical protein